LRTFSTASLTQGGLKSARNRVIKTTYVSPRRSIDPLDPQQQTYDHGGPMHQATHLQNQSIARTLTTVNQNKNNSKKTPENFNLTE
jgi:hypothetical protein